MTAVREIFVGNIPFDIAPGDVVPWLESASGLEVVEWRPRHDQTTGRFRGFGFARVSAETGQKVMEALGRLCNREWKGRKVQVDLSHREKEKQRQGAVVGA